MSSGFQGLAHIGVGRFQTAHALGDQFSVTRFDVLVIEGDARIIRRCALQNFNNLQPGSILVFTLIDDPGGALADRTETQ